MSLALDGLRLQDLRPRILRKLVRERIKPDRFKDDSWREWICSVGNLPEVGSRSKRSTFTRFVQLDFLHAISKEAATLPDNDDLARFFENVDQLVYEIIRPKGGHIANAREACTTALNILLSITLRNSQFRTKVQNCLVDVLSAIHSNIMEWISSEITAKQSVAYVCDVSLGCFSINKALLTPEIISDQRIVLNLLKIISLLFEHFILQANPDLDAPVDELDIVNSKDPTSMTMRMYEPGLQLLICSLEILMTKKTSQDDIISTLLERSIKLTPLTDDIIKIAQKTTQQPIHEYFDPRFDISMIRLYTLICIVDESLFDRNFFILMTSIRESLFDSMSLDDVFSIARSVAIIAARLQKTELIVLNLIKYIILHAPRPHGRPTLAANTAKLLAYILRNDDSDTVLNNLYQYINDLGNDFREIDASAEGSLLDSPKRLALRQRKTNNTTLDANASRKLNAMEALAIIALYSEDQKIVRLVISKICNRSESPFNFFDVELGKTVARLAPSAIDRDFSLILNFYAQRYKAFHDDVEQLDYLAQSLEYLASTTEIGTERELNLLDCLLQVLVDFSYEMNEKTAFKRLRCTLRPIAKLVARQTKPYDSEKLPIDLLKMFRNAWFNLVVERCYFKSSLAEANADLIQVIAMKSPIAVLERVTNDFDNDLELNSILRRKHDHGQKTEIADALTSSMGKYSQEIKDISYAELAFLSAVALLESSRASSFIVSVSCTYFIEPSIQKSRVSKYIAAIIKMNIKRYIALCRSRSIRRARLELVVRDVIKLISLCYYRVKAVSEISAECLDDLLKALPSLLCIEGIGFALFESLNLIWQATEEQYTNEFSPRRMYRSNLIPDLILEISDSFVTRTSILEEMLELCKYWTTLASKEAPSSFKGVIQAYLTKNEFEREDAAAVGTSLALEVGKVITMENTKIAQIPNTYPDLPLNSASDFLSDFTMRQLYRLPEYEGKADTDMTSKESNVSMRQAMKKILVSLKILEERAKKGEHRELQEYSVLMRKAAGFCIAKEKDTYSLVRVICSLPFQIFNLTAMDLGISLWTWMSSESMKLRPLVATHLCLNWSQTIVQKKGFFDTRWNAQNCFELPMEYQPSNKTAQIERGEHLRDIIRPHSHIIRTIKGHFATMTLLSGSFTRVYLQMIVETLKEMAAKRTMRHMQARYLHFNILMLSLEILRGSQLSFKVHKFEDLILRAALSWFTFSPSWTYGSNRLQMSQEISLLQSISQFIFENFEIYFKSYKRKADLLLLLINHEVFRLKSWHSFISNQKKFRVSNVDLLQAVETSWEVDPEISIYFTERFPKKHIVNRVKYLILAEPWKVLHNAEAAKVMLSDRTSSDSLCALKFLAFWKPVVPVTAINLLSQPFKTDPRIIQYAIRSLESFPVEVTFFYVPQIVQALRHDSMKYVEKYILETAQISQHFAHQILWNMDANKYKDDLGTIPDSLKPRLDAISTKLLSNLEGSAKEFYDNEFGFFEEITSISGKLRPYIRKSKGEKKAKIDDEISKIKLRKGVYLPSNPDGEVVGIERKSGKVLQSHAKAPFMATFIVRRRYQPTGFPEYPKEQREQSEKIEYYDVKQSAIFKVGDDCRQDMLALQLISIFRSIFSSIGADLYVYPYRITPTAAGCGVIDVLSNSVSRDMLGRESINGLYEYFITNFGNEESIEFQKARTEFVQSMAAYSMISYILQFKDRHNGNIMIDDKGHILHIDFGFCFDIGPGGITFENAPFKLTSEMVAVMGKDKRSEPFQQFEALCIRAMLASRPYADLICEVVNLMLDSGLPCFKGKTTIDNLRRRFHLEASEQDVHSIVLKLINTSYENMRTTMYDQFQKFTNGIPY